MKMYHTAGLFGIIALVAACATQTSAPTTNAVAMPAASGEATVASTNVVITGKPAAPAKAQKNASNKFTDSDVICKRKIITGSRFSKRLCLTRAEWKGMQDLGRKTASGFQSNGGRTNQPLSN